MTMSLNSDGVGVEMSVTECGFFTFALTLKFSVGRCNANLCDGFAEVRPGTG